MRAGILNLEDGMKRSTRECDATVKSILRGDGDRAEELLKDHLRDLREEIVNILTNFVLSFSQNSI